MSVINRMEIRGIRSYSPDKPVMMDFEVPVTLIVGHNGSGKTTVIESLKFACTGETPSNNKGHFVHDPKLAEEPEVRGQVKMQFTDILNKSAFVSRTLLTTQKLKTQTTKTLDGTIKREGKDGKVESLSMKCADLDKEMIRSLGVSRSVLNNVIFCHQEDSLWPLSEGSNVKKKFDEIFGQKRHVKCVEDLRKKFKEMKQENVANRAELTHLQNYERKAGELKEELDRVQYKHDLGKSEVDTINKQIEELKVNLKESHEVLEKVRQLEKTQGDCKTRMEAVRRSKTQLENRIQTQHPHSTEKLMQMMSSFEKDFQEKRKKEHEYTMRLSDITESHEQASRNLGRFKEDKGRLEEAQKSYKKIKQDNDMQLEQLAHRFLENANLLLGRDVKIPEKSAVVRWVEQGLESAQKMEEEKEMNCRDEEDRTRQRIDELKKTLNQANGEIQMKRDTRKKLKEDMDKLLVEIQQIKSCASSLPGIKRDKEEAKQEYTDFEASSKIEETTAKMKQISDELQSVAKEQKQLTGDLEILNLEAEKRQDRERSERDLASKQSQVDALLSQHAGVIKNHLECSPPPGCHGKVLRKVLVNINNKIKELNSQLAKQKHSLTHNEAELAMAKRQLTECESKAKSVRNSIVEVCSDPAAYEAEVAAAAEAYEKAQGVKGTNDSIIHLYSQMKQKIVKHHNCPICKTNLDDSRVEAVTNSLQKKIEQMPQKLESEAREAREAEQRFFALKAASSLCTQLTDLEKVQIPALKKKIEDLEVKIEREREMVEDTDDKVETLAVDDFEVKSVERDLDTVDRLQTECGQLKDKIAQLNSGINKSHSKTLKEAIEEQGVLQERYDTLSHQYSRLEDYKTRNEAKRRVLQQRLTDLREKVMELDHKQQGLRAMEDRRKEKALEIQELSSAERKVEELLKPSAEELEVLESKLEGLQVENSARHRAVSHALNRLTNDVENARTIEQQLSNSRGSDGTDLTNLTKRMAECEAEFEGLKKQKRNLEEQLQQIKKELNSSDLQKRDLQDCLQLRKLEKELEEISDEMKDCKKKLSSEELVSARSVAAKIQSNIEEMGRQKAAQVARNGARAEQISRFTGELNSDLYKDADTTAHNQKIKWFVGEEATKDLDMYIVAYERAIMRFHSDKMEEINKSLRDLWVSTYRGGDIDYIEIRTDDDDPESASSRKKTCHYRVVMVKGGISIDMRQHSSAGQRVLAALLIRLALAETFCDNCGIITLDEPTTNLDRDNCQSLAFCLSNFIKHRHRSGKFQLIVITHDEEFVEMLGRSEYIDYYYKVLKDSAQHSAIIKKSVAGLSERM